MNGTSYVRLMAPLKLLSLFTIEPENSFLTWYIGEYGDAAPVCDAYDSSGYSAKYVGLPEFSLV